MKKALIATAIIMTIALLYAVYQKHAGHEDQPDNAIEQKKDEFSHLPDVPIKPKNELPAIVKQINSQSTAIRSLSCDSLELKVWQGGHRYRLNGTLYYEKPQNFRMEISSIMGKEVDVGSNDTFFWYWSKRDQNNGLHFATHADLDRTRLKTPFNPMFLRSTLGIEELSAENCKIIESPKDYMIVYQRQNTSGEPINFAVFVSKSQKRIDGYLVSNKEGKSIAACEIQQYSGHIPTKILYSWYEENRTMLMQLNNPRLNVAISKNMWMMPNYTPKINMAEGN
jgi:hypothetical protein